MEKTISELLEECSEPYTKEEYVKEKAEVERLLLEKYNLKPEEIEAAMREHLVPHEELDLVDRWIHIKQMEPYFEQNASIVQR